MSAEGSFPFEGERIAYETHGSGDRVVVLIHGLLMNRRMFRRLAPVLASHGNRVICVDLLGHGDSSAPANVNRYSMAAFSSQVAALLDHLEVEQAVVGGTSLGANVSLELAVARPERVRALFIEMPVLDSALVATAIAFTPVLAASALGAPILDVVARAARQIPRTHHLIDIGLDWVRRDPRSSALVLQGLLVGRTCPPKAEREAIAAQALVVGHRSDPIHPFSDSDDLVAEMPNARLVDADSIFEWRIKPGRLDRELCSFLDRVHPGTAKLASVA